MTHAAHVCPACRQAHRPDATICPNCGLIFGSAPLPGLTAALDTTAPPTLLEPSTSLAPRGPLQPGQELMDGRYVVQRLLAAGGMGAVALATDRGAFGRTVVVKMMLEYFDPASPQQAAEARERFTQEARTLATLRHPGIPQIYAFVQDGPRSYLVMEYVRGYTLEQGLTQRDGQGRVLQHGQPYPLAQVLGWGVALCRLLEYLAEISTAPVVHQDIKPANLLLDQNSGEVRLVDFGTAQVAGGPAGAGYGTPGYAPPEQYKGRSEPRSDVYALAATLYHLLTDDDPRDHPFQFPRLRDLGELGRLLEGPLSPDVEQRPGAAVLRVRLAALQEELRLGLIRAPDGSLLPDTAALTAWCERHWREAADWLQADLPDLVALRWELTGPAQQLRALTRRFAHQPDATLDAALALLDPQGFGQAAPQIDVRPLLIDFGSLRHQTNSLQTLTVRNSGRRYVDLRLSLPNWIIRQSPFKPEQPLAPGQQLQIPLIAFLGSDTPRPEQTVDCYHARQLLVNVPVRFQLARDRAQLAARAQPLAGLIVLAALLLMLLPLFAWWLNASRPRPMSRLPPLPSSAPATDTRAARLSWEAFNATAAARQTAQALGTPVPSESVRRVTATPGAVFRGPQQSAATAAAEATRASAIPTPDGPIPTAGPLRPEWMQIADISPDGVVLAEARGDTITLTRLRDYSVMRGLEDSGGPTSWIGFSPNGKQIAACTADGAVRIWDTSSGVVLQSIHTRSQPIGLTWSADGSRLAERNSAGQVVVWSVADGRRLLTLARTSVPSAVVWGALDQSLLLATDRDVQIVDAQSGELRHTVILADIPPRRLVISPDGGMAAVETESMIELRSLRDGALFQAFKKKGVTISAMAWRRDSGLLAAATPDGFTLFWLPGMGGPITTARNTPVITALRFSPDGQRLIGINDVQTQVLPVPTF